MSIRLDLKNKINKTFLRPVDIEQLIGTEKSFIFRPDRDSAITIYSDNDNGQWIVFTPNGIRMYELSDEMADFLYYYDESDITEEDFKFCDFEIIVKEV